MKNIEIKQFGKDHWSLLAYVDTRCVDHKEVLDIVHLRTKHPAIATTPLGQNMWEPEYGTRLKGYWKEDGTKDESKKLLDHDDHDCLDDLEKAGLLTDVGTMINPFAALTKEGWRIATLLRQHKAAGGQFADFDVPITN